MFAPSCLSLIICCIKQFSSDGSMFSFSLDEPAFGNKSSLFNGTVWSFKGRILLMLFRVAESLLIISPLFSVPFFYLSF